MTNHIVYFKKSDDFWAFWLIYVIFKKSDNAQFFWLIIYDFFSKYNRKDVLNNQKLGMNMPQFFKTKYILNFRKHKVEKKFRFGGVKIGKIK